VKLYIGIDPGLTGAIASITTEGIFIRVADTPVIGFAGSKRKDYDDGEMAGVLISMTTGWAEDYIVAIESQSARPGQGVSSMLKLGVGYGLWRGIIASLRLRSVIVQPRQWVGDMRAGKEKAQRVLMAKRLFPNAGKQLTKTNHGRADALLIAEWARRNIREA